MKTEDLKYILETLEYGLTDCSDDNNNTTNHFNRFQNSINVVERELNKNDIIPDVVHQREQFKSMVFDMANKLAIAEHGDEAVMMHKIHNRL